MVMRGDLVTHCLDLQGTLLCQRYAKEPLDASAQLEAGKNLPLLRRETNQQIVVRLPWS